ncbi:MAG TPA: hypothetical protein VNG13_04035 [Mycobacteriales bacterium]|nr:hypothetical protein [Mycobacteriales bacterium]
MSAAVLAAAVGATPPTLAALLAYTNARAARREGERTDLAGLAATVNLLGQAGWRMETAIGRVESPSAVCGNGWPGSKAASTPSRPCRPDRHHRSGERSPGRQGPRPATGPADPGVAASAGRAPAAVRAARRRGAGPRGRRVARATHPLPAPRTRRRGRPAAGLDFAAGSSAP